MSQLHKKFTDDQIKVLLEGYNQGQLSRAEIQDVMQIGKSQFFKLLKKYRQDPDGFTVKYQRESPRRISAEVEEEIKQALLREKVLVDDPDLPITSYNYTAMRDRLLEKGIQVSVPTIINRAKQLECHHARRKRKTHDREVLTSAIGALIQHDASTHLWSPYAKEKWVLITSIDDYSRKLLFADFFRRETTWAHIQATQTLIQQYGLPVRYYVDSLRVFRFVQGRDSVWRKHVLQTDDVETQWRKMMRVAGVDVNYALSPQAKGKVERPYRWLQDRIVRSCAYDKLSAFDDVRKVLNAEVLRYNNLNIHSTTGEIPNVRFDNAIRQGNSLFRHFVVPDPFSSPQDVFCFREKRLVNGYRRVSLFNHQIKVPNVPLREYVDIHMSPDIPKQLMHIRFWWHSSFVHSVDLPLDGFSVHF